MVFEAYITNLGKYNEGALVGEYLKFPATAEDVQGLLKRIGVDGVRYEEIFITDFQSDILGLYDCLNEYDNIDELNHLAHVLTELDQSDLEKFEAAIAYGENTGSVKDLINLAQNLNCYDFIPGIADEEDLGRYYIEEMDALDVPEHLRDYIDYEAYWCKTTINKILNAREYMGDIVNFKTYSKSFKNKQRFENPEENHMIFEGVHEAIIDRETWEMVQRSRQGNKRRQPKHMEKNMFSGLLYCSDCGRKLYFNVNHPNTDLKYFNCSNYKGNRGSCNSTHYIRADALEQVVLLEIRRMTTFLQDKEESFIKLLMSTSEQEAEKQSKRKAQELRAMLTRCQELDGLFSKTYEDNASGKLSDERFMMLTKRYDDEQVALKKKISALQAEIDKAEKHRHSAASFLRTVKKYTDIQELTPTILNELVEKIIVYQADGVGKGRTQRLEIHYNFVGTLDTPEVACLPQSVTIDTRQGVAVEYITRKSAQKRK